MPGGCSHALAAATTHRSDWLRVYRGIGVSSACYYAQGKKILVTASLGQCWVATKERISRCHIAAILR